MSNHSSASAGGSAPAISNGSGGQQQQQEQTPTAKKKRNLPGNPDPDAEVIALSPRTLMATNRFVCEVCNKGFQRDQNLQLHRRGHNLPWRLRQRSSLQENVVKKRVYVCPEPTCVHHDPCRALGDLTGIKKHFYRKHGEKKWQCDRCSKRYAVHSDWKAHQKTCGTREYRCDCGTPFSRRDSFITHRAFCDVLAEENARASAPTRPDESQQSGGPDGSALNSTGELISAAMEVPSSPASQLTGGPVVEGRTSSEVSKPNMINSLPDFPFSHGGATTSKWMHTDFGPTSVPLSKGPGLSLCLGTGPGPGPPGALPVIGNQALLHPVALNIAGAPGYNGTGNHDQSHPPGARSMFANLTSSCSSYGSQGSFINGNDIAARPSGLVGITSQLDQGVSHGFGIGNLSPKAPLYKSGSAHMSATALLQKAAQMGATSSNNYLLRNLGHVAGDPSFMAPRRPGAWVGPSTSSPSVYPMRQAGDLSSTYHHGLGGSAGPLAFGQGNSSLMNPMSGGFGSSVANASLGVGPSSFVSSYMHGNDSLLRPHSEGPRMQPSFMPGMPHLLDNARVHPGIGSMQRRDSEGDRPMLDFLGVGAPSRMVSTAPGIGQSLSQRDLVNVTFSNSRIKAEPSFDQSDSMR